MSTHGMIESKRNDNNQHRTIQLKHGLNIIRR